jgi:hypothetical protein
MSRIEDVNYRKSGLLLSIIVTVIYALLAIRGKHHPAILITAVVVAICAWCEARPLRMMIVLLIRLGNIMHRFTNPLVFGLVYIVAVVPTALVLKLLGKDTLNLRYDRARSTYWITRPDGGAWKNMFRNQY